MRALREVFIGLAAAGVTLAVGWPFVQLPELPPLGALGTTPLASSAASVRESGGTTQRQLGDAWVDLSGGDKLYPNDRVRTSLSAFAWITSGSGAVLQLAAESELVVSRDDPTTTPTLRLTRGSARLPDDNATPIVISVGDAGARVTTTGGNVEIHLLEDGSVTLVNRGAGQVTFVSGGESVELGPKSETVASRGQAPVWVTELAPMPAPVDVVAPRRVARTETTEITGKVDPARVAQVTVAGVAAEVAEDGTFTVVVPLEEGINRIAVLTRDVFGNQEVYELPPVRRLTTAEIRALKFEWSKPQSDAVTTWGD